MIQPIPISQRELDDLKSKIKMLHREIQALKEESLKETPACAAIQGENWVTFAGKDHESCLRQVHAAGHGGRWLSSSKQGFMTTHGRFVEK